MDETERFEIKEEHLKLLKAMNVSWWGDEFGAPGIDPKRPYGNSDVYRDMIEILGITPKAKIMFGEKEYPLDEDDWDIPEEIQEALNEIHRETKTVLQICLVTGKFEAGIYSAPKYADKWEKIGETREFLEP